MTEGGGVDLPLMAAWLAARSIARGLPAPVPDAGGLRVDSGLPDEHRRYLFVAPGEGLRVLGAAIDKPFVALKLCGSAEALMALLPDWWRLASSAWVMGRDGEGPAAPDLPPGYRMTTSEREQVRHARVFDATGSLAASGFAVEGNGVFIYDRIRTEPAHERRGLGRAVMAVLADRRRCPSSRQVLTATAAGRGLYRQLGWHDLSPYVTATIPPP